MLSKLQVLKTSLSLAEALSGSSAQCYREMASLPARTTTTQSTPQLPPFNYHPRPYQGPTAEEVLALRKKYLSPGR
jgi:alanine-glyoxylate transaminase/(R)-3-amino-2-methylpropionate-pyruvate transaminase